MRQRTPVSANTRTAPIWPPAYTTPRIAAKPDCNGVGTHPQPHRPSRGHARHRANRAHPHTLNEIQITDAGPHPLRMHHGLQSERRNVQLIVRTSSPIELDCPGVIPEMFNNRVKTSAYSVLSNASMILRIHQALYGLNFSPEIMILAQRAAEPLRHITESQWSLFPLPS